MMNRTFDAMEAKWLGIYHLLNQDRVWVDRQHQRHDIAEMSVRYKQNVIGHLERRASSLANSYSHGEIIVIYASDEPIGDMAELALDEALDRDEEKRYTDPVAWLRKTSLLSRLRRDVEAGVGGEDG